jgi:uncharacterized membrane-anchored protein
MHLRGLESSVKNKTAIVEFRLFQEVFTEKILTIYGEEKDIVQILNEGSGIEILRELITQSKGIIKRKLIGLFTVAMIKHAPKLSQMAKAHKLMQCVKKYWEICSQRLEQEQEE